MNNTITITYDKKHIAPECTDKEWENFKHLVRSNLDHNAIIDYLKESFNQ